eukprot:scaffold24351_cov140-Isochrysis_galbana.AAC.2
MQTDATNIAARTARRWSYNATCAAGPSCCAAFAMQACSQPHWNLKAASRLGVHCQFLGPLGLTTLSFHKVRRPPGLAGPPASPDSGSDSFSDSSPSMTATPAAEELGACEEPAERPVADTSARFCDPGRRRRRLPRRCHRCQQHRCRPMRPVAAARERNSPCGGSPSATLARARPTPAFRWLLIVDLRSSDVT